MPDLVAYVIGLVIGLVIGYFIIRWMSGTDA